MCQFLQKNLLIFEEQKRCEKLKAAHEHKFITEFKFLRSNNEVSCIFCYKNMNL